MSGKNIYFGDKKIKKSEFCRQKKKMQPREMTLKLIKY